MAESEEELKSLLMKVKEESEKPGLKLNKLNIQKTKIMASGPITSWEIDGETMQTVSDFIFWGSEMLNIVLKLIHSKVTRVHSSSHLCQHFFISFIFLIIICSNRFEVIFQIWFANKFPSRQGYGFFSRHVWM